MHWSINLNSHKNRGGEQEKSCMRQVVKKSLNAASVFRRGEEKKMTNRIIFEMLFHF